MKKILVLSFLLSLLVQGAFADSLKIEGTTYLKVFRGYNFKVVLEKEDGTRVDVTNLSRLTSTRFELQISPAGRVEPRLPNSTLMSAYYAEIYASHSTDEGEILEARTRVQVDITPDFLRIRSPFSVNNGDMVQLRAYGHFSGRVVDLTHIGRWSATYGRISTLGTYFAAAPSPGLSDRVTFTFGNRNSFQTIRIY